MNYSQKIIESAFLNKPYEIKKLLKEAMAQKIGLILEEQLKELGSNLLEYSEKVKKPHDIKNTPKTDPVGDINDDIKNNIENTGSVPKIWKEYKRSARADGDLEEDKTATQAALLQAKKETLRNLLKDKQGT
jgi:hypothetical protein